ncbi:MAG: sigma-54-dependent Fis family transcriptional regulator [Deltaproteobacteria bacterium]|nr:sigma-54-dependent Fis family transcriptional regulator [Deltaproteobacteria bacterium]MBW2698098.1 sigma-54-dependent Fis family transcriptional regulator [Deltaproteobacteria bacterium]
MSPARRSRRSASDSAGRKRQRRPRVLVVDDAEGIRTYLENLLGRRGYEIHTAEDGESALEALDTGPELDLVLLDIMMPGMDGIETLRRIRELAPALPVVIVSVIGRAPTIVEAMQLGASDFVSKPFEADELEEILERLLGRDDEAVGEAGGHDSVRRALWSSRAMSEIREVIEQISDTNVTVLIQGESGVGKEIVARAIHEMSTRADGPFVKVNCAALPEDLLESELFGYEKGAFTGAHARKFGKFEVASGGTIFLDEIGEMSPGLQAKLLQVLQDSQFARLGGNREVTVDVRVVCATHRPLLEMVSQNDFREDLYFRLNVVNVQIPPLRERREEISLFVETFISRYSAEYRKPAPVVSDRLMAAFSRYSFPGNVRELENMVKRIVVLEGEESILNELARREAGERGRRSRFHELLAEVEETAGQIPLREVGRRAALEVEREAIDAMLHQTGWNRKKAAKLLGVSYKTLLQKIRECELEAEG